MSAETKIIAGIIGGTILLVGAAAFLLGRGGNSTNSPTVDTTILIRADSHAIGSAQAKVTVVEFSDFQCPACKAAEPTVEEILNKYQDKIKFVYREFPLPSHEFGLIAAQAAEVAGLQNKFWEYHDKLFEKSPDLSRDNLFSLAKDLGLDMDKFTKDLDSDTVKQKVQDDIADGNKAGVSATPTFYINGTQFTGVLSLPDFQREIDSRLK